MSKPPEGVVAGETVPVESEPDEAARQAIEHVMNHIKARHPSGAEMSESERREKAKAWLRDMGVEV